MTNVLPVGPPGERPPVALESLGELAQSLFTESGDALFLFDPESEQLLDINPMALRLTGFTRAEVLEFSIHHLFRAELLEKGQRLRQASSRTAIFHSQEGFLLRHRQEGVWTPVNLTIARLHPLGSRGGKRRAVGLVTARDISERRRAEETLRRSEAKYRSLIENLEQCIFLKDAQLRFLAANQPFCQGLGRTESEIIGKTDFAFYPPALAEKYQADDRRVLEGQRTDLEEENVTAGQRRTVRVVKTPVKDDTGRIVGVLGIFWDVTEQRALEAKLRQASKMEAVGRLAGGVAHDFNNLLTAILGNLSLIQSQLPAPDPAAQWAAAAEKASLRAAALVRQMLGFARQRVLQPEPMSLNSTIDEVVSLLKGSLDPSIVLEVRKAENLNLVHADLGQMNQVLLNLCLNARDAMPTGGRLLVETANVLVTETQASLHVGARPGEMVRLRVLDTGTGIPGEVLPHIFEPFFTTKEPGRGTGLGLALVYGIVQQHQGWVDGHNEPRCGACFDVHLPCCCQERAAPEPVRQPPLHGQETLLLADDEPLLRSLAHTILHRFGYEVLLAADGVEALEVYQRERHRIDLVILDLTMPRISGREAFRRLRELDPEVRVLFASGFAGEQILPTEREHVLGFVSKPFRPADLVQAVRAALEKANGKSQGQQGPPDPFEPSERAGSH